tara:strand:+ start:103 stop:657 length:555 start_codon:yes stop_codon:yes gene_type:complete
MILYLINNKNMKNLKFTPLLLIFVFVLTSCSSVRVVSDYDSVTDFTKYKTFAFYKPGIDKAKISDLDKKRIMRQIEANLKAKGLTMSKEPDMLVSLFTKEKERIDVYNNNFYGYGAWYGGGTSVSSTPEGTLYIDLIDRSKNELIWQGIGKGDLIMSSVEKKEARIKEIVTKILAQYPPVVKTK